MGELIRPGKVTVVTKDGEVTLHITIDLNINLNTTNTNTGTNTQKVEEKEKEESDDDKVVWAIPSFKSSEKLKF